MRHVKILAALLSFASALTAHAVSAEEIRDYYAEPGLHPFKDPIADLNETIDPFSGMLQLRHTDITVPGNGGLDIKVNRFYLHHQDGNGQLPAYSSLYGIGWTMHFGRIVVPQAAASKICTQSQWATSTLDNPSIEHPDGSRELLVLDAHGNGALITKSNWRAECDSGNGMLVSAPNGTRYKMDQIATVSLGTGGTETSWYTSEISDAVGNSIHITYQQSPNGYLYIDEVTGHTPSGTSDGRLVKFTYATDTNNCFKLREISSNNQVWHYTYQAIPGFDPGYTFCGYNLSEVTLPSGQRWQYEYYPYAYAGPGKFSVRKVTYPYGGMIEYTYQEVQFDPTDYHITTAVQSKTTSGPSITPGTWTYAFSPGAYTNDLDLTIVTQPNGRTEYVHQGAEITGFGNLWAAGLMLLKDVYSPAGDLLERTLPTWDKRLLSYENYYHGRDNQIDSETYAPILIENRTWRNGGTHSVINSNHDIYGNPGTVEETTNLVGEPSRITNYTYYNDRAAWIIGVPEHKTIAGIGTIDRTINGLGQMISESKYGVQTSYTYSTEGDLHTVTDARNNTITYNNYYRGIARDEAHPENVTMSRVVNTTGTVASITNGRGFTKSFGYDGLNRLAAIDFPVNADVTVDWMSTGKTLTRGNYRETVTFDGFGKDVQVTRTDLASGETITKTTGYDALGQKVFESYANSVDGIQYTYDVIGRLVRLEHPDGAFRSYAFGLGGLQVTETDERGNQTDYIYRAYGHPDNARVLKDVLSPDNVCTLIGYNTLGQVTYAHQGDIDPNGCLGFTRHLAYDAHYFLIGEENPETGTTTYGRDELGNMITRQVGASGVTGFTYDGRNRLTFTDYPGATPDVTRRYDENDNLLRVDNADSQHQYLYDANDNLESETIGIGANTYTLGYTYDTNDSLATVLYPSGRLLSYAPDAFGRPRRAAPYVTAIAYHPSGQIERLSYANGQTTDLTLTNRLWVARMHSHGVAPAMDLTYRYDAIGNVESITDAIDPFNNRVLGYDNNNRLVAATGQWGMASFAYSSGGDIEEKYVNSSHTLNLYQQPQLLTSIAYNPTISNGNIYASRYDLLSYDGYGNIAELESHDTSEIFNNGIIEQKVFTYDDAANLRQARRINYTAVNPLATVHDYGYDGNSMRVSKVASDTGGVEYAYAKNANLLGEYDPGTSALYGKEYFYLGSQLVASAEENQAPVADAGTDASANRGQQVGLNGSGSSDPDGGIVTYAWQQLSGTLVTLSDAGSSNPTFIAPAVGAAETLTFQLTVTDNDGATASDSVNIQVLPNTPPIANAGPDQTLLGGTPVRLDGSASSDAEGPISYQWTQLSGPTTSLNGASSATPGFTAPLTGSNYTLNFKLVVTDSAGLTAADTVAITVYDPTIDTDADGLADGWEIIHFGSITLYRGNDDPDGDGLTNLREFAEGTDPNTPAPAPTRLTGVEVVAGNGKNTLFWDNQNSVLSYNIYWSTTPGVTRLNGTKIAGATQPFVHAGLTNGTTYYYVVTAANNTGESPDSAQVFAKPGVPTWNPIEPLPENNGPDDAGLNDWGSRVVARVSNESGTYRLWVRNYNESHGWSGETLLVEQTYRIDSPHVAINNNGNAVVAWAQFDGTRWKLWTALYNDSSRTWKAPQLLYQSKIADNIHKLQTSKVSMNDTGSVLVTWADADTIYYPGTYNLGAYDVYASIYTSGNGWSAPVNFDASDPTASWSDTPDAAMNAAGQAVVAWKRTNGSNSYWPANHWAATYSPGSGWSMRTYIFQETAILPHSIDPPRVGIAANGNVVAVWRQDDGSPNANSEIWEREFVSASRTWLTANRMERSNGYLPDVVVDEAGDAMLLWNNGTDILGRYRPAGGNWGSKKTAVGGITTDYSLGMTGMDGGGNVFIFFDWYAGQYDLGVVRYDRVTNSYSDPVYVSDRNLGELTSTDYIPDYKINVSGAGEAIAYFSQYAAGSSGPSGWHDRRYAVPPPVNQPPVANAGPDQSVTAGDAVTLNGSGSGDPESNLIRYQWVQTAGPAVTLNNATSAIAGFTALTVTQNTMLRFTLIVTDNVGQSAADEVVITVRPAGGGDTTPPVTTGTFTRTTSKGKVYYAITLAANEPATNHFRLTGQAHVTAGGADSTAWQTYTGQISAAMDKNGTANFDYYSVDSAGNTEATHTEVLQ